MVRVDEERPTEETPLMVSYLTSPSLSIKSSSFASLSHLFPSERSLAGDGNGEDEHSAGSLEKELIRTMKEGKVIHFLKYWLSWQKICLLLVVAYVATSVVTLNDDDNESGTTTTVSPTISPPLSDFYVPPFTTLDPVKDLHLGNLIRTEETSPSPMILRKKDDFAVPTNQWYQNMLLVRDEPTVLQRVYSVPYILDVIGPIPGIQIHPPHIDGSSTVIQLSLVETHGITLGSSAARNNAKLLEEKKSSSHQYSVLETTPLGITLNWNFSGMTSSIVRGMPYATMIYPPNDDTAVVPTIVSRIRLREDPIADGTTNIKCGTGQQYYRVERELQMTFFESDFTWIAFFSEPVLLQCMLHVDDTVAVMMQFQPANNNKKNDLIARLSLLSNCTTGNNPIYCKKQKNKGNPVAIKKHANLLRKYSGFYPGSNTSIRHSVNNDADTAEVILDWDSQYMYHDGKEENNNNNKDLIAYALPHQLDTSLTSIQSTCTPVILGQSCIVVGSEWELPEALPPISFYANRPPRPDYIMELSMALKEDFTFQIPGYYKRGAGDTYFSGKILAKVARLLLISEEVREICSTGRRISEEEQPLYEEACRDASIPTIEETDSVLSMLRESVEVWLNGTAETPFVYDDHWGGLVSCGCFFDGETESCSNKYPDCPVANDPGLNFGNGFYNDHHFHYGYHIYAAAVVAKYDPSFGQNYFQEILLFIRDIANPSLDDTFFPLYRHKDWYTSHSWASGISDPYLNGRNQESSSEAIAAYEAVALFGTVMVDVFSSSCGGEKCPDEQLNTAKTIRNVGRLLTATEIKGADRYWHIRLHDKTREKLVPDSYQHSVIGMIWNTMAQFQTWFGNAPYLAYGIQLLPLTPISEYRDDSKWLAEMYKPFADSCESDRSCEEGGWSILQLGILAAVGHPDLATERCQALSEDRFTSAGGNGHSRSNTLWFISTRPTIETPLNLDDDSSSTINDITNDDDNKESGDVTTSSIIFSEDCQPCSEETCNSDLHRCSEAVPYLCIDGAAMGGCSPNPWDIGNSGACSSCCTWYCDSKPPDIIIDDEENDDDDCGPCSEETCNSDLHRCSEAVPYLCNAGSALGGCSDQPWDIDNGGACSSCCTWYCDDSKPDDDNNEESDDDDVCEPCSEEACNSQRHRCSEAVPYLCNAGSALGGCSMDPWDIDNGGACSSCCTWYCDY